MTDRLTLRDWQIINNALALYEAEGDEEFEDEADAHARQVEDTRNKVHQRLQGRYGR